MSDEEVNRLVLNAQANNTVWIPDSVEAKKSLLRQAFKNEGPWVRGTTQEWRDKLIEEIGLKNPRLVNDLTRDDLLSGPSHWHRYMLDGFRNESLLPFLIGYPQGIFNLGMFVIIALPLILSQLHVRCEITISIMSVLSWFFWICLGMLLVQKNRRS